MIKFHCGQCGQKLGVPEKYAGRTVRCTGCKEGVRVPELEPEPEMDPVLEPIEEDAFDAYDVDEPIGDDSDMSDGPDALAGLAGLAGPSAGEQVLQPAPTAAVSAGSTCPKCGSPVGEKAVICVQCGHNLKLGVNVKTVAKAKATAGFASKTVLALVGGAVVACVAGGIWGGIVIVTNYEIGWVAWGIGALVGFAVAAMAQKQDAVVGFAAACLALLGLLVGKAVILQWMMSPGFILTQLEMDFNEPETFAVFYMDQMYEDRSFEPDLQLRLDEYAQNDEYDQALEDEAQAAASQKAASLTQAERDDFIDDFQASFREDVFGDESFLSMLKYTITPWDGLWFLLAITSAWRIGNGGFGND